MDITSNVVLLQKLLDGDGLDVRIPIVIEVLEQGLTVLTEVDVEANLFVSLHCLLASTLVHA